MTDQETTAYDRAHSILDQLREADYWCVDDYTYEESEYKPITLTVELGYDPNGDSDAFDYLTIEDQSE